MSAVFASPANATSAPTSEYAAYALSNMDPLALGWNVWWMMLLAKLAIESGVDRVFDFCATRVFNVPKMPSREPFPIAAGLEEFETIDIVFLSINQIIEMVWMMNFCEYCYNNMVVDVRSMTVYNTVVPFYVIFFLNDFFYYWGHRWMHHPSVYALVHKHHHRQILPVRAYLDGVNVHPIESYLALAYIYVSYKIVNFALGDVHALSCFAFFMAYSLYGLANHAQYDISFGGVMGHSARTHETHHRFSSCNYAQSIQWYDTVFGTYKEYSAGSDATKARRFEEYKLAQKLAKLE